MIKITRDATGTNYLAKLDSTRKPYKCESLDEVKQAVAHYFGRKEGEHIPFFCPICRVLVADARKGK